MRSTFRCFCSAIASSQSALSLICPGFVDSSRQRIAEPISATTGAAIGPIAIDFGWRDVDLHEFRRRRLLRTFAVGEKPV
jgi:hypothetical protein